MATNESSRNGGSSFGTFVQVLVGLFIVLCAALIVYGQLPSILKTYRSTGVDLSGLLPTSIIRLPAPGDVVVPRGDSLAVPTQSLAQIEATSQAIYQATVQAVPIQNVNTTGDSAPVVREQKESQQAPAQGIIPTSEPIQPAQSDGAFGSKPAKPVNIQETHQCLHAQVWTDRGCKNPTPTQ